MNAKYQIGQTLYWVTPHRFIIASHVVAICVTSDGNNAQYKMGFQDDGEEYIWEDKLFADINEAKKEIIRRRGV